MNYWPADAARARDRPRRSGARLRRRAMRSAATITRCCARGSRSSSTASPRRSATVRLSRVHRQRAGARSRARREGRPRLARQAHAPAHARSRARISSSARSTPTCRCRRRRPRTTHCGTCTRVHRRVPDRRHRRALRARRAALHLVPDDRASTARFPRSCVRSSAIACTAATTASSPARGTGSRRRRREADFRAVRHGLDRADAGRALRVDATRSSTRGMAGSAIRRIGYERWLRNIAVGLGNAPASAAVVAALERARTIRRRWCASTWRGRSAPGVSAGQ